MDISPNTEAICPIFFKRKPGDKLEQIGSSVLINVNSVTFLLTVAHVLDFLDHGFLFVPTNTGFTQLYGNYCSFKVPVHKSRSQDKIDIAYFKLNSDISNRIHHSLSPYVRENLHLSESLVENDLYTFSGYPVSKAKNKGDTYSSEIFHFTGHAASKSKYVKLGYSELFHIVVNFNRKNCSTTDGVKQMAPHPKGISGGGVYSWPKDIKTNEKFPTFHLVGIGHTYKEEQHCFVATRINAYLASIYTNNPDLLPQEFNVNSQENTIPLVMGIIWYLEDEWGRLKEEFDDSDKMHKTWNEWRQATEDGIEHMARNNKIMYPVVLEADKIEEYCTIRKVPNTSQHRTTLMGEILVKIIQEKIY